jgi:tRNA pseudouridine32 synthase/23S rRNA pseudouridine746 synthase
MKVYKVIARESGILSALLSFSSKLPPEKIADACAKGAVWLQKGGKGKILKERNANYSVKPQDILTFYYDPRVLSLPTLKEAECLEETKHYGVWIKKAGVVTQGTQAGDHTSLLRYVEVTKKKETFLVHRLDRETEGLTLIAYTSEGAAKLSALFQENRIKKTYEAVVLGTMTPGRKETINASLDDKEAITHFEVLDSSEDFSLLRIEIETGRLHQIRRHLDHIGHPVMGDPKYGKGNKNREGLKLKATSLSLKDPWEKKEKTWTFVSGFTLSR